MALDVTRHQLVRDRRVVVEEPVLLAERRRCHPVRPELNVVHGLQQEDRKVDRDQRVRDHRRAAHGVAIVDRNDHRFILPADDPGEKQPAQIKDCWWAR